MSFLIVEPYLIELVRRMDTEGFLLIVAGGLGLHLKRRWVGQQVLDHGRETLMKVVPEARPTIDIDVFLQMEIFTGAHGDGEQVVRFRRALESLSYDALEKAQFFQFKRKIAEDKFVKVDLHTRLPNESESGVVKYNKPRVGRRRQPSLKLHAYGTPEAFAIDDRPQTLPLIGVDPEGQRFEGHVRVPHPFAALCMKIQAAKDFEDLSPAEREDEENAKGQKHAFDVYLLLAMLDLQEVDEVKALGRSHADNPLFEGIRAGRREVFGVPDSPGCHTIRREAQRLGERIELERFTVLLGELFA